MKIFIVWSGRKSKKVAQVLHEWIKNVIQVAKPWMSSKDIDKGTQWSLEIAKELKNAKIGIICLTANNLKEPWIYFESGALTNAVEKAYVCPYLFGLEFKDVTSPLSQFQLTKAEKEDTYKLVETINKRRGSRALSEKRLKNTFEKWWPDLEKSLKKIEKATEKKKKKPSKKPSKKPLKKPKKKK